MGVQEWCDYCKWLCEQPELQEGDMISWDRLRAHDDKEALRMFAAKGRYLLYYSCYHSSRCCCTAISHWSCHGVVNVWQLTILRLQRWYSCCVQLSNRYPLETWDCGASVERFLNNTHQRVLEEMWLSRTYHMTTCYTPNSKKPVNCLSSNIYINANTNLAANHSSFFLSWTVNPSLPHWNQWNVAWNALECSKIGLPLETNGM